MPTVSVIIPNFNREHLIGETLRCLLNQTRPADEIIVVDDGSTDGSVEVLKSFGDKITLITQPNSGPAVARNRGMAAAKGDFIQFFDSDDLCSLNKLEVQAEALERTGADFAYGPWLQATLERGTATYADLVLQSGPLPRERSPLAWFLRDWVIVFQCCMFRRDILDRVGPYRTDLMPSEDSELLFRILKAGGQPVHTPDCLVLYRVHDLGISQGGIPNTKRIRDWLKYVQLVSSQFNGPGEVVDRGARHAWEVTVYDATREARGAQIDDPSLSATIAPGYLKLLNVLSTAKRLRKGMSRRFRRSNFGRSHSAAALTLDQQAMIQALGYKTKKAKYRP